MRHFSSSSQSGWFNQLARLPLLAVVGIALAYVLPGLVGHDPWKADEAYVFGTILHILQSGDWVVPTLAGEPFMEKPPIFNWLAVVLTQILSPTLDLHDAARMACAVFMGLALIGSASAAQMCWGKGRGRIAVLLVLSSVGLLTYSHLMMTDIALVASFGLVMAAWAACYHTRWYGGILLGVSAGIAFLSKGLLGVGVMGITSLLLPVLFSPWRNVHYVRQLILAFIAALPFLVLWPYCLYLRAPELFDQWFWVNNVGRFTGSAGLGADNTEGFWLSTYPWFFFPLWLFLPLLIFKGRRADFGHGLFWQPAVQIGGLCTLVWLTVLGFSASGRANYALPLIPGLALLLAGVAERLPKWLDGLLHYAALALWAAAFLMLWGGWFDHLYHQAAYTHVWFAKWLPNDFLIPFSWAAFLAAVVLTVSNLLFLSAAADTAVRGLCSWLAALSLAWGLLNTLWLPWLDAAKSYRSVFEELATFVPSTAKCVESQALGEGERAMLHYFGGIKTLRDEVKTAQNTTQAVCEYRIVQRRGENPTESEAPYWRKVWSGARMGDRRERFDLYRRDNSAAKLLD